MLEVLKVGATTVRAFRALSCTCTPPTLTSATRMRWRSFVANQTLHAPAARLRHFPRRRGARAALQRLARVLLYTLNSDATRTQRIIGDFVIPEGDIYAHERLNDTEWSQRRIGDFVIPEGDIYAHERLNDTAWPHGTLNDTARHRWQSQCDPDTYAVMGVGMLVRDPAPRSFIRAGDPPHRPAAAPPPSAKAPIARRGCVHSAAVSVP